MLSSGDKTGHNGKPMYTQKQVEDMLDTVGNCFLSTIVSFPRHIDLPDLSLTQSILRMPSFSVLKPLIS